MHRLPWQSIPEIRKDTTRVMYKLLGASAVGLLFMGQLPRQSAEKAMLAAMNGQVYV